MRQYSLYAGSFDKQRDIEAVVRKPTGCFADGLTSETLFEFQLTLENFGNGIKAREEWKNAERIYKELTVSIHPIPVAWLRQLPAVAPAGAAFPGRLLQEIRQRAVCTRIWKPCGACCSPPVICPNEERKLSRRAEVPYPNALNRGSFCPECPEFTD